MRPIKVGALPPLMGYAGCMGYVDAAGLVAGAVLYAWQFPHFNALSWNLRSDYSKAGYRMMAVTDPGTTLDNWIVSWRIRVPFFFVSSPVSGLCLRTTLRYSLSMIGICTLAPWLELTTWTFAVDSLPANLWLVHLSWNFYRFEFSPACSFPRVDSLARVLLAFIVFYGV